MKERLVLGTAQLGMPYGINNRTGKPDMAAALGIVRTAIDEGVCSFDTAQAYGDSEAVLGQALHFLGASRQVNITTKFAPDLDCHDSDALRAALERSFERLKVPQLWGLLLHHEALLDEWDNGLSSTLGAFLAEGKVRHVGVSVYSPVRAIQALEKDGISLVQIPTSILDQRFEQAGVFRLAAEKGKQICIRSVFLQGLVLMKPGTLPPEMKFAEDCVARVHELAAQAGLSVQALCLNYVLCRWPQSQVIFGAETPEQVRANVRIAQEQALRLDMLPGGELFPPVAENIVNPGLWPKRV